MGVRNVPYCSLPGYRVSEEELVLCLRLSMHYLSLPLSYPDCSASQACRLLPLPSVVFTSVDKTLSLIICCGMWTVKKHHPALYVLRA